jgi:hypothetical protein
MKPREGQQQLTGKKKRKGDEPPEWMTRAFRRRREVLDKNPRYSELLHQTIRLRDNGVEMEWGRAQSAVEVLRTLQQENAEAFTTLVALAKPRGATRLPSTVPPQALAALRETEWGCPGVFLDADGSVMPNIVFVLDAAYTETEKDGVVLRDPVDYPSRQWVEKWAPIDRKVQSELARINRLAAQEAEEERRKRRGQGEGPSP